MSRVRPTDMMVVIVMKARIAINKPRPLNLRSIL